MQTPVPNYIREIFSRACWDYDNPDASPGYTVKIAKRTDYVYAPTFCKEIEGMCDWVKRVMRKDYGLTPSEAEEFIKVHIVPDRTHLCRQYAVVSIFDPMMRRLEGYVKNSERDIKL